MRSCKFVRLLAKFNLEENLMNILEFWKKVACVVVRSFAVSSRRLGLGLIALSGIVVLGALSSATLPGATLADGGSIDGEQIITDPEDGVEQEFNTILFHFVDNKLRVKSYNNKEGKFSSKASLQDILADHDPDHLSTIIFRSAKAFRKMDSSLTSQIRDKFEEGSLILGLDGTYAELHDQFDILEEGRPGDPERDGEHWIILRRAPDGHLNELMLTALEARDSRRRVMTAISQWKVARTKLDLAQAAERVTRGPTVSPGWKKIYQYTYRPGNGRLEADGEDLGSGQFIFDVYYAGTSDSGRDYYLVETNVVASTDSYHQTGNSFGSTSGTCGYWIDEVGVGFSINTPGAVIESYMPETTVGSSSSSQSIGASVGPSISSSAVGASGSVSTSVSRSFTTPDVKITAHLDYSAPPKLRWKADLQGCRDFSWYPDYTGASAAAKSTYSLWASAIVHIPAGEELSFRTRAPGDDSPIGSTYMSLQKVHMKINYWLTLHTSQTGWFWEDDLDITCNSTSCSYSGHD